MKKLLKTIRPVTPDYHGNLTWSTIKVRNVASRVIVRKLKLLKKGRLSERIKEHNRPSYKTAVNCHIKNCFAFAKCKAFKGLNLIFAMDSMSLCFCFFSLKDSMHENTLA